MSYSPVWIRTGRAGDPLDDQITAVNRPGSAALSQVHRHCSRASSVLLPPRTDRRLAGSGESPTRPDKDLLLPIDADIEAQAIPARDVIIATNMPRGQSALESQRDTVGEFRSAQGDGARAAKREQRVRARGTSLTQFAIRPRLMAVAVATCCRCVLASPR